MAKINYPIPKQAFEVVRDQIATILKNELANQATLDANFSEPEVYINRFVDLNHVRLPAVNVTTDRGNYQNQSVKHQYGLYTFQIEAYHKGAANSQNDASEISEAALEELMGRVRAILASHQYYSLDIATPKTGRTYFQQFTKAQPQTSDTMAVSIGVLEFVVEVSEIEGLQTPQVITSNYTTVLIKDAFYGYLWVANS
jgi:hypothetical protein